ncbi:TIGR03085 family metal-binding protein [Nocardioides jensenii]|uniref:TIGR03085 family metal-binding protein n=1 Tax=Nocardioides jensenii TaxID=1843 RepID=UPI00083775A2|nr:TIGR03085 family metal-binding protein [Nocardioides jensenii]
MSTTSLAHAERNRLCDLALDVGAGAPTLSGEWTVKDLVVHMLVRERTLASPGILVPALGGLVDRATQRLGRREFTDLVEDLRRPRLTWAALPVVDRLLNTAEYFVHHEDIRRAQPSWTARDLTRAEQASLWRVVSTTGRGLVRPAGVPVLVRDAATGREVTLRRGSDPVLVVGPTSELLLMLFGRARVTGLEYGGPEERVRRFRAASLGI